jgi:hypothetical protein
MRSGSRCIAWRNPNPMTSRGYTYQAVIAVTAVIVPPAGPCDGGDDDDGEQQGGGHLPEYAVGGPATDRLLLWCHCDLPSRGLPVPVVS